MKENLFQKISDGQRFALNKLCNNYAKSREERLFLLSFLLGKEVKTTAELSRADWQKIRDLAYENWNKDDWMVSEYFDSTAKKVCKDYQEKTLGQGVLWE